jgi:hypothetical protein
MSLTAIIMTIIGIAGALLGGVLGHRVGKAQGVSTGVQQQVQTQQVEQAKATVQAVKERAHVEVTVAADSDSELDARLSKHDRPD